MIGELCRLVELYLIIAVPFSFAYTLIIFIFICLIQGDYEKAGMYYMASVKESNNAHEFVLPYYGM